MNEELIEKLAKWFRDGNTEMKREIRKYVYGLSNVKPKEKEYLWEKIVQKAMRD